MGVTKPANKELSGLESFLDNQCGLLEGSDFHADLEGIYEDLDSLISDLKDRIEDQKDEIESLEGKIAELEG